jgi:hypothetical protein
MSKIVDAICDIYVEIWCSKCLTTLWYSCHLIATYMFHLKLAECWNSTWNCDVYVMFCCVFQHICHWGCFIYINLCLQTTFYIFGISEQFAIRKSTISIYRATSNFDLHMRIFNLQDLGAPDKPKKIKIKYAEIDFTLHHSFLMLRKVEKINLKLHHTKKTQPIVQCLA